MDLTEFIPATQVPPIFREYDRAVFFNWKNVEKPFTVINKSDYGDTEIRQEWFKHQMTSKSRQKILKALKCYPDHIYSMFAKLEKGMNIFFITFFFQYLYIYIYVTDMPHERQMEIIDGLTYEFQLYMKDQDCVSSAYARMVDTHRYRILSNDDVRKLI